MVIIGHWGATQHLKSRSKLKYLLGSCGISYDGDSSFRSERQYDWHDKYEFKSYAIYANFSEKKQVYFSLIRQN